MEGNAVVEKENKHAKQMLQLSLEILEKAAELAMQKEDLEGLVAISDRLMVLYQHLDGKPIKKFKAGFALIDKEKPEDDESDQR